MSISGMVPLVLWLLAAELLLSDSFTRRGDSLHVCPGVCICASDLLSCVSRSLSMVPPGLPATATSLDLSHNSLHQLQDNWLAQLPRLHTLRVGHNRIRHISAEAFHNASQLMHLDLSSNKLHSVEEHFFQELTNLQELLLYNNQIARVDSGALLRLSNVQKVYLSWNLLTDFPFSILQEGSLPQLKIMDISSNRLSSIPIDKVIALPQTIKNGLFLHNNPFMCDCTLYRMFLHWEKSGFNSVHDFREEHTCLALREPKAMLRFLKHRKMFENCTSAYGLIGMVDASFKGVAGEPLLISCNTSLQDEQTTYLWISPNKELITYANSANETFKLYSNGSLEISKAQKEHSGVYTCMATNKRLMRNESHEVNVTVHYQKYDGEGFNTGLTTLLGCVVSLVLVLMYLYLTPCRCWCRPTQTPSLPNECSAQSSILTATPPCNDDTSRKVSSGKHVVFLEPVKDCQNGKIRLAVSEEFPAVKNPKILQLKTDSDSTSSIFSDTSSTH
ncbi:amphoterin-induced protein 3 [Carcharodon carcharias]|uniref:amphoterin-induced protein 3 n=1 Tax=Carcharodon carcharias TaxID=13397 RepID=UPI001B7DF315|nr:amphoterin-induced protein 3 [Carcharodon carcharias]